MFSTVFDVCFFLQIRLFCCVFNFSTVPITTAIYLFSYSVVICSTWYFFPIDIFAMMIYNEVGVILCLFLLSISALLFSLVFPLKWMFLGGFSMILLTVSVLLSIRKIFAMKRMKYS